ncbi:MAG: response regulator [Pseudomonadota bacterium]
MPKKPTYEQLEKTIDQCNEEINDFDNLKKEFKAGKEKYQNLFENAIEGIFQSSADGNILSANPALVEIFGYDSTQQFIASITDIPNQLYKNPKDWKYLVQTLALHGKISGFEVQQKKKNGDIIWSSISARAICDDLGRMVCYEGMLVDITDRKQAEIKLKASNHQLEQEILERRRVEKQLISANQYLENILDNSADSIGIVDQSGKFILWNFAAAELFGFSLDEIKGKSFHEVYPDQKKLDHMLQMLRKNGFVKSHEMEMKTKDGSIRPFEISITMLNDESGNHIGSACVARDLSHLKKALKEAEAANKAKREFLANLSHEIRTPMNAVIGFTELLDSLITDRRQKNYLKAIKSGGKGLLVIINDILDLSIIESGKLKIRHEPVNLRMISDEIKNIFSMKLSAKGLDFSIEIDPDFPEYLMMDEIRVRQILLNLIGNAIKFTDRGFIKLSIHHKPASYTDGDRQLSDIFITLKDTGTGIPEEEHQFIFEPFTQKKGQDPKIFGGTGLGLSICKRLVERMKGEISVKSTTGCGACFNIRFKDISTAAVLSHDFYKEPESDDIIFEPATILAVDDVKSNLILIKEYLKETGITVISAQDGEQAWYFAKEYRPELILMDIRMPVMDGYEATRLLKSDESLMHIPVIAISAVSPEQGKAGFKQKGFEKFLRKPISRTSLFNVLSGFLKHSRKKKSSQGAVDDFKIENLRLLPELIEKFETDLLPVWSALQKKPAIREIRSFAQHIQQLGENADVNFVKTFGADLLFYVEDFDIQKMRKRFLEFPILVDELKMIQKHIQSLEPQTAGKDDRLFSDLLKAVMSDESASLVQGLEEEKRPCILIVDDNPKHIQLIGKTLSEKGYAIEFATSGEEALEWVSHTRFDLILLDVVMPGMTGFDVCRQLKTLSRAKDIPVIFLTVKTEISDIVKGFQIGVVDYVTKPFNPIELMARVETHLELKSSRDMLKKMALTDGLTQLYNHGYIHERLSQEISRAVRAQKPLSVVMFDLDYFKNINDTYGHKTGDKILVSTASLIKETLRKEDIAGRYGGEEFLVILPDTDQQGALWVAEKIRSEIETRRWDENALTLTISGGVCALKDEDASSLIKKADQLLYQAKNEGRNKICVNRD